MHRYPRIGENWLSLTRRVENIARSFGRNSDEITIIAVSKTKPIRAINEAETAGACNFGENRVQELCEKFPHPQKIGITVHFIGHLQSNKVKLAVQHSHWIQSVDSRKILELISKHAEHMDKIIQVCIEVNTSGDKNKYGLQNSAQLDKLIETGLSLPNIELRGLMTIGPFRSEGEEKLRDAFRTLRDMHTSIGRKYPLAQWNTLSMGMSNDFDIAIAEGANMIRIGSSIFGSRETRRPTLETST